MSPYPLVCVVLMLILGASRTPFLVGDDTIKKLVLYTCYFPFHCRVTQTSANHWWGTPVISDFGSVPFSALMCSECSVPGLLFCGHTYRLPLEAKVLGEDFRVLIYYFLKLLSKWLHHFLIHVWEALCFSAFHFVLETSLCIISHSPLHQIHESFLDNIFFFTRSHLAEHGELGFCKKLNLLSLVW